MSSMNFTCDVCGREVFSCTFVNGMKFCAKCYQETFGETDKDRKISDLEAKLAESEKQFIVANNLRKNSDEVLLNYKTEKYGLDKTIQELRKMKLSLPEKEWYYKGFENCERQMSSHIADLTLEVKELKQQLAEKEKEKEKEKDKEMSIKSIIRTLVKYNNLNCTFRDKTNSQIQQCGDVYNSNYGYFNFEDDYDECLNNRNDSRFDIISIDLDNQDKISFAVEQLEQLKKLCQEKFNWWENSEWEGDIYDKSDVSNAYFDIEANVDNQIEELKKEMK